MYKRAFTAAFFAMSAESEAAPPPAPQAAPHSGWSLLGNAGSTQFVKVIPRKAEARIFKYRTQLGEEAVYHMLSILIKPGMQQLVN